MNDAAAAPLVARRRAARASALCAMFALVGVAALASRDAWAPAAERMLARGSGWVALSALLLSLCVTPLAKILARIGRSWADAGVARRALGMSAAWLAFAHALIALATALDWDFAAVVSWPHLRAGLSALSVLMVLLATSFGAVVARLRLAFWKELHRLGYVAALLVLQHLLLSPFAPRGLSLLLFGIAFLFGLARFL